MRLQRGSGSGWEREASRTGPVSRRNPAARMFSSQMAAAIMPDSHGLAEVKTTRRGGAMLISDELGTVTNGLRADCGRCFGQGGGLRPKLKRRGHGPLAALGKCVHVGLRRKRLAG